MSEHKKSKIIRLHDMISESLQLMVGISVKYRNEFRFRTVGPSQFQIDIVSLLKPMLILNLKMVRSIFILFKCDILKIFGS